MGTNEFGFAPKAWNAAIFEATELLSGCARRRQMIPYSDFVAKIHSVTLEAHDPRLGRLLGEVSANEMRAGRGMLSALVTHKRGDMQPGPGFFELAKGLGQKVEDIEKFWIQEVKRIFAVWSDE